MRLIFFLLLLTGCINQHDCMVQSDTLPLQWYNDSAQTPNTRKIPGIDKECWFQPWRCDVNVVDQFYDSDPRQYVIRAIDHEGVQIFQKSYITTQLVQDIEDWVAIPGADEDWQDVGTSEPYVDLLTGISNSDRIKGNVSLEADKTYRFFYKFGGTVSTLNVLVRFRSGGSNITPLPIAIAGFNGVDDVEGYVDYTPDADADDVTIEVGKVTGGAGSFSLKSFTMYEINQQNANVIYSVDFNPEDEGLCDKLVRFEIWDLTDAPTRIKHTDLVNFSNDLSVNVFEYTASVNYDNLIYDLPIGVEVPVFKICVEGVFFHEKQKTEQVSVDLTDEVVGTATSITTQKLLAIQPAPDWFHLKLQSILSHGLIGSLYDQTWNKYWIKEEEYEKEIVDQHTPTKKAEIYLTQSDSPKRGVI